MSMRSQPKPLELSVVDRRDDVVIYITVDGQQRTLTGKHITIDGWSLVRARDGIIAESCFSPALSVPLAGTHEPEGA